MVTSPCQLHRPCARGYRGADVIPAANRIALDLIDIHVLSLDTMDFRFGCDPNMMNGEFASNFKHSAFFMFLKIYLF